MLSISRLLLIVVKPTAKGKILHFGLHKILISTSSIGLVKDNLSLQIYESRFQSQKDEGNFLISKVTGPPVSVTQPPVHWVSVTFSLRLKIQGN